MKSKHAAIEELGSNGKRDERRGAIATLEAEHARLVDVYAGLLSAFRQGDWLDVEEQWSTCETALRTQMDGEEAEVFPCFLDAEPREIARLVDEHDVLRKRLEALAVDIELHCAPVRAVEQLLEELKEHAAREEAAAHRWMGALRPQPSRESHERRPDPNL